MEEIKSLEKIRFDLLFETFKEAFIDYELQVNPKELQTMLNRRGFVPELSFGAFDDGKLVAFTFNGIGLFNNIQTAYDTGTGTLKEYRGQGLATKVFMYSLPYLKKANINQYLLEVLQHNTNAVSVYQKIGFTVSREFNYFSQKVEGLKLIQKPISPNYHIQPIDLSFSKLVAEFWDFVPSWQNSFEAIARKSEDFKIFGAFEGQNLIGYCVFEPNSGDITQIAVHKGHRRKGIATNLLEAALKSNLHSSVKCINTEIGCSSITSFLQSIAVPLKGKQFEMIKQF